MSENSYVWEGSGNPKRWPVWLAEKNPHFVPDDFRLLIQEGSKKITILRGDLVMVDSAGSLIVIRSV
ncbi:MAG: hypothetical protein EOP84_16015 [Verrucomicrobiaceae bacterium]|nr:MAG: hypothetical protein EOP84_16015 [Verrucomicrobiaceae bacterium]